MQNQSTTPGQCYPAVLFTKDEDEAHEFVRRRLAIAVVLNGQESIVRYDTGDAELRSWSTIKAIARAMHRCRGKRTPWNEPLSDGSMIAYQWGDIRRLSEAQAIAFSAQLWCLIRNNLVEQQAA